MSKLSSYAAAKAPGLFSALVAKAQELAHTWFDNFRAKEFAGFVGGSYVVGHSLAAQCNLGPSAQHTVGGAMAAATAVAYIRNPKKADWVTAPTDASATPSDPTYGVAHDPLDESRHKDKDGSAN